MSYTTPEGEALQGINFHPNVKGTGQPVSIRIITGTIILQEDTAGNFSHINRSFFFKLPSLTTILSDVSSFRPVTVPQETNEALNIQVIPQSDTISLELDDRIILRFTPVNPVITPEVYFTKTGEFLRDLTVVQILDDDSECCVIVSVICHPHQ